MGKLLPAPAQHLAYQGSSRHAQSVGEAEGQVAEKFHGDLMSGEGVRAQLRHDLGIQERKRLRMAICSSMAEELTFNTSITERFF